LGFESFHEFLEMCESLKMQSAPQFQPANPRSSVAFIIADEMRPYEMRKISTT